jgi:hypothetical protein
MFIEEDIVLNEEMKDVVILNDQPQPPQQPLQREMLTVFY